MGLSQSNLTKHTFIDIDTSGVDGSAKDPRKVQSWSHAQRHTPSRHTPSGDSTDDGEDEVSEPSEDVMLGDELSDDWISDISRLKTVDPMDAEQTCPLECVGQAPDREAWLANASRFEEAQFNAQLAATKKPEVSFWNSWNISDNARKAMQERRASAPLESDYTSAMHTFSGRNSPVYSCVATPVQAPTMLMQIAVPVQVAVTNQQATLWRRLTTSRTSSVEEDKSTWTCRMVRNIPNDYTRNDLVELLDSKELQYDFLYLPIDWRKKANLGYAFANLVSHEEAERMANVLNGLSDWKVPSEKVCEVVWGKPEQQSLHRNVERFRNSPVMHPDVPEECKPLLFTLGQRSVFPAPTMRLQRPRGLNAGAGEDA